MSERSYSGSIHRDTTAGDFTGFVLTASTAVKPAITMITLGAIASTPADKLNLFRVQRVTTTGTGTAFTPVALDPGQPAAVATCANLHTVEPTYTAGAVLLQIPSHEKASYQWWALPGFELFCTSSANNGIGIFHADNTGAATAATAIYHGSVHWRE